MWNLSSKHPRRLKFDILAYINQTKRNLDKKWALYPTPRNPNSSQAKADPGLAPAML